MRGVENGVIGISKEKSSKFLPLPPSHPQGAGSKKFYPQKIVKFIPIHQGFGAKKC